MRWLLVFMLPCALISKVEAVELQGDDMFPEVRGGHMQLVSQAHIGEIFSKVCNMDQYLVQFLNRCLRTN
jgi:hypothetical protein